jgi:prepilin-type N-terminal cleavage/methylation domain-containing protein
MHKKQFGFSLIEVMIAMCLLAIVLLGMAELQLESVRSSQQALMKSEAVLQLNEMAAFLQQNRSQASFFLREWNEENQQLLPDGEGSIQNFANQCLIFLQWKSGENGLWNCDKPMQQNYACVELKVVP